MEFRNNLLAFNRRFIIPRGRRRTLANALEFISYFVAEAKIFAESRAYAAIVLSSSVVAIRFATMDASETGNPELAVIRGGIAKVSRENLPGQRGDRPVKDSEKMARLSFSEIDANNVYKSKWSNFFHWR